VTGNFILWAQALDNASPDHFDFRGAELSLEESDRRQEAVSLVSRVIKRGARIYEENGVLLTADDRHFVVEVPSAQLDNAGRTAPIVCYGEYDGRVGVALAPAAAAALSDFAKRIGRTLQPEHFKLVQDSFETLKKKSSTTKLVRTVWLVAVGLVLFAIVYWLAQRG
jgi:hypothetical protein